MTRPVGHWGLIIPLGLVARPLMLETALVTSPTHHRHSFILLVSVLIGVICIDYNYILVSSLFLFLLFLNFIYACASVLVCVLSKSCMGALNHYNTLLFLKLRLNYPFKNGKIIDFYFRRREHVYIHYKVGSSLSL